MTVNELVASNNSVKYASTAAEASNAAGSAGTAAAAATEVSGSGAGSAAVYEPSVDANGNYKPDKAKIDEILAESDRQVENFRKLVQSMLSKQSDKANKVYGGLKDLFADLEVDEATRLKYQEEISEDGYWGVKQTSQRLLDFAKAVTGGDPSKIEEMREAVQKGFDAAERVWGGKLPQISQDTYDAVMKGFDEWAAESKGENTASDPTKAVS